MTKLRIVPRHELLPQNDSDIEAAAKACCQVDKAVSRYHQRLRTNDWPKFVAPPRRLKEAA